MDDSTIQAIIVGAVCTMATTLIVVFTHAPYGTCLFNICTHVFDGVVA